MSEEAESKQKHSKGIQDEVQGNLTETKADAKTASASVQQTVFGKAIEAPEGRRERHTELLVPTVRLLSLNKISITALNKELSSIPTLREAASTVPRVPTLNIRQIKSPSLDKSLLERTTIGNMVEAVVPRIPYLSVRTVGMPSLDRSTFSSVRTAKSQPVAAANVPRVSVKFSAPQLDKSVYVALLEPRRTQTVHVEETSVRVRASSTPKPKSKTLGSGIAVPSLLGLLFRSPKGFSARGLLRVSPERPVIVVAIKSPRPELKYRAMLLQILVELYRIKRGLPQTIAATARGEADIVQSYLMQSGIIKFVDDSEADFLDFFEIRRAEDFDKVDPDKLRSRLLELTNSGFSFLVFHIDKDKAGQLLRYLWALRSDLGGTKIVVLQPHRLSLQIVEEIARAAWGFAEFGCFEDSIDGCFSAGRSTFYDRLEALAMNPKYGVVKRSEGDESELHYLLKVFVYSYLTEKAGLNPGDVKTEPDLGGVRPDVWVEPWQTAIEIETLYGTGVSPWSKLNETVEKYRGLSVKEVWIIIPPLQLSLFIKGILKLYEAWREEYGGRVRLLTVDLSRDELVPVEECVRRVREMLKQLRKLA